MKLITLDQVRTLRQTSTDAEKLLWHYLRAKRLKGHKFRRQHPMGPYVVDFVCLEKKLIIELDGGQHALRVAYDQTRDRFLRSEGYVVLRFWNNEVLGRTRDVLEEILRKLGGANYSS